MAAKQNKTAQFCQNNRVHATLTLQKQMKNGWTPSMGTLRCLLFTERDAIVSDTESDTVATFQERNFGIILIH